MRDFSADDPFGISDDTALMSETGDMTQQGFKRFRRKQRHNPVEAERLKALPDELGVQPDPAPMPEQAEPVHETVVPEPPEELFVREDEIQLPAHAPDPWDLLRQVPLGLRRNARTRSSLISFFREDPAAKQFDLLRTRLLQSFKERGWSRVAVTAPTRGCGTTFSAVNLALSLSRVPETRTILMDLNQRNPGIASALGLSAVGDMPGFLAGRVPVERHLLRCDDALAVGVTAVPDPNAAEILHDAQSGETLDFMCETLRPDVVVYDLPPILEHDDVMAFLPQVDGVLLVADGTTTTREDIEACERVLDNQTQLLGVVLNKGR